MNEFEPGDRVRIRYFSSAKGNCERDAYFGGFRSDGALVLFDKTGGRFRYPKPMQASLQMSRIGDGR